MKRILATLGLILVLIPQSARGAAPKLYDQIQEQIRKELLLNADDDPEVEKDIRDYLSTLPLAENFPLTEADINTLLTVVDAVSLCEGNDGKPKRDLGFCSALSERVQSLAATETLARSLGRELQAIATSFEASVDGYPGRPIALPSRYTSLVTLWRAGTQAATDRLAGSPLVRTLALPDKNDSSYQSAVDDLKNALNALEGDARIGAVWRYQFGHRFVAGSRPGAPPPEEPDLLSGPGSERQFLTKRWDGSNASEDIEGPLQALWTRLSEDIATMDPPLKGGELVLFQAIDLGDAIGWAFFEQCPTSDPTTSSKCIDLYSPISGPFRATGDVGLHWRIPLEPVQPSLLEDPDFPGSCTSLDPANPNCPAIAGGRYPPEPVDGEGLCTMPIARDGYLCKPITGLPGEECLGGAQSDPEKIVLTRCEGGGAAETIAGPNICRTTQWRNPYGDPDAAQCMDCRIDLQCVSSTPGGGGTTYPKDQDGNILIEIDTNDGFPDVYITVHELAHAQQICHLPPGTLVQSGDAKSCCAVEAEAHAVECNTMAQDGIFLGTTITVEQCIAAGTEVSCAAATGISCGADDETKALVGQINKLAKERGPKASCGDQKNATTRDPRVQAMLDGLLSVSNPECKTKYLNTIGNHMCAVGQFMEETLEYHRLTPMRSTFSVQDETYPWESCEPPHPLLAGFYTPPPQTNTVLPNYRPAHLVAALEKALCQVNGLPPKVLPILCGTSASRRLDLELLSILSTATHLVNQVGEQGIPTEGLEGLAHAYGTRIGTDLYTGYLRQAGRSLGEVVRIAADLLGTLERVEFSPDMCPRNAAKPNGLGTHGRQCTR